MSCVLSVAFSASTAIAAFTTSGDISPTDPSTWTSITTGYIGKTATGDLTINGGSDLISYLSYIGYNSGSTGIVTVDGSGSTWTNGYTIFIGNFGSGSGTLNVSNGGSVSSSYLYVGDYGSGTLNISNGGNVSVNGTTYVGEDNNSTGAINFGSNGGTLTTQSLLASPSQLTGTGTINTRGLVSDIDLVFDATHGLKQTITLNSMSGQNISINLNMADTLGAGYNGTGSLAIKDGVTVSSEDGYVGYHSGSMGTVTVDGPGSTWTIFDSLDVGHYGSGTLNISNGGRVSSSQLYVGPIGNGILNICNGGSVSIARETLVDFNNGSTGAINFSGSGGTLTTQSLWASPFQLTGIGTINTRGLVSDIDLVFDATHGLTQTITLNSLSGQNISINLDMTGSPTPYMNLGAGYIGTGSLTIKNGVSVTSSNGYLGYRSGSTGTATVDGSGSMWTNSGDLEVGNWGSGTLNISNGGSVSNNKGYIGYLSGSAGTVTVDGSGSTWTNSGDLYVGYFGAGSVFQTGGTNSVAGTIYLGQSSSVKCNYNLNGGKLIINSLVKGSTTAEFNFGGGTLQAGGAFSTSFPMTLTGTDGNANIDSAGYPVTLSGVLSGPGGLNKLGSGTLTISASNAYTGDTKISGGNITLANINALQRSTLDYNSYGGTLSFGTLTNAILGGLKGSQGLSLTNTNSAALALQVGYNGQSTEYSGSLSGSGSLSKIGTGTFTLSGSNSFTGSTIIKAGTVVLDYTAGNTNKLSYSNKLQINGPAALQIKGGDYTEVVSATALNGGTLELSRPWGGASILRMNAITSMTGSSMNLALAGIADTDTNNTNGILAPSGRACATVGGTDWAKSVESGAADTAITAYSDYTTEADTGWATTSNVSVTGSTSLSANRTINTLKIDTSGSGQSLNIGTGRTLSINAGGLLFVGADDYSITNGTLRSMTTSSSDLIIQTYATGILSIGSIIADGRGPSVLTKTGSETLTLTGSNTFSGDVNFDGGLIRAASLRNLGNGSTLNFNGGGLQFDGVYNPSSRTMTFQSGGAILDTQTYNITLSYSIGNGGDGGLTKQGSGILTLSGANSFSGAVNFNGGLINAASLNNLGNGAALNFNGGGLQFSFFSLDPSVRTMTFKAGGATLDTQTYNITMANPIGNGGAGGLVKKGTGKLTLNALIDFSGDTTVNGGTLEIAGGVAPNGTSLIDVQSGAAVLKTTTVNKTNLNINTAPLATFEVVNGAHTVGVISGNGTTQVDSTASLTAASISQGTLTIGSGATVTIEAIPGGPLALGENLKSVPEPSTIVFLGSALLGLGWVGLVRRREMRK